ncbi:hypothetical protein [Novosphingobium mangrovi (ex Huang et al. 2023)]|uniref:Uncharacterized protein n=1 Tax=Novosphingobium mangrovi (ex Huang et al. 2023) TaxID=2976432 RepID=A0ABT2I554_9SPHN|nr:hypothetical protein [Novosphingobium mangrovi (ex Huang et al. 2023)]MCT2399938.1 hypothetical protein [Novosphingobium mangrovi (ex Huang et al. 2023)]
MSFSAEFLSTIIYGSLIWCALTGLGLAALLIRDMKNGDIW